MEKKRINLWEQGEYSYPLAFSFQPNLMTYLHADGQTHPAMLVVPGGGYRMVSPTESEIVAERFYDFGYNAFVLTYTTNPLLAEPLQRQPLMDISRAVRLIRTRKEEFCIDPERTGICGFSAGGHLCASLCVHYEDLPDAVCGQVSNRPDFAILCYPVIHSREFGHEESIEALVGKTPSEEQLDYFDLTRHVTEQTPPCFLWHTWTDVPVPVQNSIDFAEACRKKGVPVALHLFSQGNHGLSTADRCWAQESWKTDYVLEQVYKTLRGLRQEPALPYRLSPQQEKILLTRPEDRYGMFITCPQENSQVAVWPKLVKDWLASL